MGYTHYWRRPTQSISVDSMNKIVNDFNKIVLVLDDMGVRLADGFGENTPEINSDRLWFNGLAKCGHSPNQEVSIPWPAPGAKGIGPNDSAVSGNWFAGSLLDSRCCDGDCSYETFCFERELKPDSFTSDDGRYFDCTKTAYRPYDVAVTAALIIIKHYCPEIDVQSDGEDENWQDAKNLCQFYLGYGFDFTVNEGQLRLAA